MRRLVYRRIYVRRYGSAFVVKGLLSFINIGPCLLLVHIKYPYGSTEVALVVSTAEPGVVAVNTLWFK